MSDHYCKHDAPTRGKIGVNVVLLLIALAGLTFSVHESDWLFASIWSLFVALDVYRIGAISYGLGRKSAKVSVKKEQGVTR